MLLCLRPMEIVEFSELSSICVIVFEASKVVESVVFCIQLEVYASPVAPVILTPTRLMTLLVRFRMKCEPAAPTTARALEESKGHVFSTVSLNINTMETRLPQLLLDRRIRMCHRKCLRHIRTCFLGARTPGWRALRRSLV